MRFEPGTDHLELWRGIDDAVWRETLRAPSFAVRRVALAAMSPVSLADASRLRERTPQPAAQKVPEPA